jgi:hypothetical protein
MPETILSAKEKERVIRLDNALSAVFRVEGNCACVLVNGEADVDDRRDVLIKRRGIVHA